jgi:hypothetical protein
MALETNILEQPTAAVIFAYQKAKTRAPNGHMSYVSPCGSSNDFVVGADTGIVVKDHAIGILAATFHDYLEFDTDFGSFDKTIQYWNYRKFAVAGQQRAYKEKGVGETPYWGFMGGLSEIAGFLADTYRGAVFQHTVGGEDIQYSLDAMLSGELMTNAGDSIVNRANFRVFQGIVESGVAPPEVLQHFEHGAGAVQRLAGRITCVHLRIQGDDNRSIWRVSQDWGAFDTTVMIDLAAAVAAANGLEVNATKTRMRRYSGEFLKKESAYGFVIPVMNRPLPLTAESAPEQQTAEIQMRDVAGRMNTMVARGHDPDFMLRHLIGLWNAGRMTKYPSSSTHDTYYALPYATLNNPISLGGSGVHRYSLLGASKDIIIAYDIVRDPDWRRFSSASAHIMRSGRDGSVREIAKKIRLGETTPPGILDNGLAYLRNNYLDPHAIKRALGVRGKLADIVLGNLVYEKTPERLLESAIASEKSARLLKNAGRLRSVSQMVEAAQASTPISDGLGKYDFLLNLDLSPGELLEGGDEMSPYAGLAPKMTALLRAFKFNPGRDPLTVRASALIDILRASTFPADITEEQLMSILTSERIAGDFDLMQSVLIRMGASPEAAAQVVQAMTSRSGSSSQVIGSTYSWNDDILTVVDRTMAGQARVTPTFQLGDANLENFVRDFAYYRAIYHMELTGEARTQVLTLTNQSWQGLKAAVNSVRRFDPRLMKYNRVYPDDGVIAVR